MTPEETLIEVDRELAQRSLANYVQIAWSQIETNRLVWNWHMGAMCEALEALYRREIRRLVISLPPGGSKSLLISSLGPSWVWGPGGRPQEKFICTTYEQMLSEKNARLHRDLVASVWYQQRWGDRCKLSSREEAKVRLFSNDAKGWRFSTSVDGAVLGRHGTCIIGDDLVKIQDAGKLEVHDAAWDFWSRVLSTRQADPKTTTRCMIAQRLHEKDVPARCIEAGYHALIIPMRWDPRHYSFDKSKVPLPFEPRRNPDPRAVEGELYDKGRLDEESIAQLETDLGPGPAAAQLQQNPIPDAGLILKREHFENRYAKAPRRGRQLFVDAAFKGEETSDEVSISVGAREEQVIYAIDQVARRMDFLETIEEILRLQALHNATGVWIEDKANGSAIMTTLKKRIPGLNAWDPKGSSKPDRARATIPIRAAGNVLYPPEKECGTWWEKLVQQAVAFPKGANDDRVDSDVMMVLILGEVESFGDQLARALRRLRDGVRSLVT